MQNLSPEVKAEVAKFESLSMVVWYFEELTCDAADAIIQQRLENGEGCFLCLCVGCVYVFHCRLSFSKILSCRTES